MPMQVGPRGVAVDEHNRFAIQGALLGMGDPDWRPVLGGDGGVVGLEIPARQPFKLRIRGAQDLHGISQKIKSNGH